MKNPKQSRTIVVVGDYCRKDFLQFFVELKDHFKLYFLEYSYKGELRNDFYTEYGTAIFWKDFSSAQGLLKKINPGAILFFFIESLNHVALLNACKGAGIRTFHVEHGFRDLDFQLYLRERGINFNRIPIKKEIPFDVRFQTRLFFEITRITLPRKNRQFLSHYKAVRLGNSILDTFLEIKSDLRTADHYISLSPGVYKFHQQLDGLRNDQLVSFIGLPNFDYIINDSTRRPDFGNPNVVFIDSGFHIEESYGWTRELRANFLRDVRDRLQEAGFILWVKKHPLDNTDFWAGDNWNIFKDDEWYSAWKNFSIVLGEYSTLMIPLATLSHTVCFCFESHPVQGYKTSDFLIEGGVCEEIEKTDKISMLFKDHDNLLAIHKSQSRFKDSFLKKWLTFLDGSSTRRFTELILRELENNSD